MAQYDWQFIGMWSVLLTANFLVWAGVIYLVNGALTW